MTTVPSEQAPRAAGATAAAPTARPTTGPSTVQRFDRLERYVHWANATLFAVMVFTGASLYIGSLSALIGRRELVRTVHVYAGLLLPLPLLLGFVLPKAGRAFRADARTVNRWDALDKRWFRSLGRDRHARPGKFNAGQKLNAAFTAGAIPVMLLSGAIMRWFHPFPLAWRTGATFVHDSLFLALVVVITGHVMFAFSDPESLGGMLRGDVSTTWARKHHPRWPAGGDPKYRR